MTLIKLDKQNSIYTITLNRSEVRNAFNDKMISEMTELFKSLQSDQTVRAVILKGDGESFCAGADLNWMKSMVQYTEQENIEDSNKLYDMFSELEKVPVPVIGQIHGHAMGGAMGLVALCDIVAAETDTKFCFSEVRLGLAPAVISSFVAKKMSRSQLHRWFLTAEIFDGSQAHDMGLIHFCGDKASVEEFVKKVSSKVSNNGPEAVRATKKLIQQTLDTSEDIKKETVELIAKLRVSAEGQEGLNSFFNKNKPNWI